MTILRILQNSTVRVADQHDPATDIPVEIRVHSGSSVGRTDKNPPQDTYRIALQVPGLDAEEVSVTASPRELMVILSPMKEAVVPGVTTAYAMPAYSPKHHVNVQFDREINPSTVETVLYDGMLCIYAQTQDRNPRSVQVGFALKKQSHRDSLASLFAPSIHKKLEKFGKSYAEKACAPACIENSNNDEKMEDPG